MTDTSRPGTNLRLSKLATLGSRTALVHGLVVCTHLAILILLYSQTYYFDYVHYDDSEYVLANSAVLSGLTLDSFQWAFTSLYMHNWHPLTWLSHMLDVSLFGEDPSWAHVHNFLLHGVNSLLVYAILFKLSANRWKALLLSLVFLVHPLHVESVAWIAERKDLLCAIFFLLGLLFYDSYRAKPSKLRYAGVLVTFALALMAKPMAVTFPAVLIILDFFVYRRCFQHTTSQGVQTDYSIAILEKLPLLAISIASSAVTIIAQDTALMHIEDYPLSYRWKTATTAYLTYLKQFLFPVDLAAFYPLKEATSLFALIFPSIALLVIIVTSAIFTPTLPLIATGLCFYLITLLPVIGLLQVGSQAHADRYMYLPSLGVLIGLIYIVPEFGKRHFQLGAALSAIFIAYLATISYWQIGYWENRHTLFSRVLEVNGPNYIGHLHLGQEYFNRGLLEESRKHLSEAMSLAPRRPDAYQTMGHIALIEEEFQAAEQLYRTALLLGKESAELHNNLGISLAEQGRTHAGINAIERALEIKPTLRSAQENLAAYKTIATQEDTPSITN